jgi:hypothetical protein
MQTVARVRTSGSMAHRAFVVTAWAFVACLVVQFFLVGLRLFDVAGLTQLHRDFAYIYGWLAPILVLLAGVVGASRRAWRLAVALLVLFAIQTYLPTLATVAPGVAALHAPNALLVFWVALQLARAAGPVPDPDGTRAG